MLYIFIMRISVINWWNKPLWKTKDLNALFYHMDESEPLQFNNKKKYKYSLEHFKWAISIRQRNTVIFKNNLFYKCRGREFCIVSLAEWKEKRSAAFRNTRGIASREEEESCEHEHKDKQDVGQEQKFQCEVWKYFLAFITERTWWSPRRMDMHTQKFTYFWQSIWIFYDRITQYSSQEKERFCKTIQSWQCQVTYICNKRTLSMELISL